jgi:site-specific recombinase XerD
MGHVRDRMEAALKLAGLSESTRYHYIGAAKSFVKFFRRSPEKLGEPEVWKFLLYQREVRSISVGRYLVFLGALRFLFTVTLQRPEVMAGIPWPKMHRHRPEVMTRDEVARVLDAARTPYWRTFLTTAYAAGLRRMEVAALRIGDIDSRAGLLRVVAGKGDKAREVMLDPVLLERLRAHWRREGLRGPRLFPAQTRFGGWADHAVDLRLASAAFREAADKAALTRRMTLRSLRTAFATHLLEDGVDIFTLQQLLGHEQLETTARYAVVRTDRIRSTPSPLAKLTKLAL